jgi:hypothetical protein
MTVTERSKPLSTYQHIVFNARWAAWFICLGLFSSIALMFVAMDTIHIDFVSLGLSSRTQLIGMMLLITLMPVWLIGCFFVTQRHTLRLAHQLQEHLQPEQDIVADVSRLPTLQVGLGALGGFFYALAFNIPHDQFSEIFSGNLSVLSIFVGQILLWTFVGHLLAIRLYIANLFYQLGKTVELSIFEQSRLEPFARVGMLDVVIVVGGLAITTVQSIDAQFRLENYLTAFLVAIPAAVALLVRPMWTLHRRLAARKQQLLREVRQQIESVPEATTPDSVNRLEILLQRRDRVRALHTWPLDFAIWSRLLFYGLIPPLAWAGAALVERAVERILGV